MGRGESDIDLIFSSVLRGQLKGRSIPLEKLASEIESTLEEVSLIASGQHSPPLETMLAICSVLKISLPDLALIIEEKRKTKRIL